MEIQELKLQKLLQFSQIYQNYYLDKDMNGKQLGKFSSAEVDQKLKYMQKSLAVTFLTYTVHCKNTVNTRNAWQSLAYCQLSVP